MEETFPWWFLICWHLHCRFPPQFDIEITVAATKIFCFASCTYCNQCKKKQKMFNLNPNRLSNIEEMQIFGERFKVGKTDCKPPSFPDPLNEAFYPQQSSSEVHTIKTFNCRCNQQHLTALRNSPQKCPRCSHIAASCWKERRKDLQIAAINHPLWSLSWPTLSSLYWGACEKPQTVLAGLKDGLSVYSCLYRVTRAKRQRPLIYPWSHR